MKNYKNINTKQTSEMFSFKDTYFDKLPEELIDYIWQFNHDDAALIINYYARKYICNSVLHIKESCPGNKTVASFLAWLVTTTYCSASFK